MSIYKKDGSRTDVPGFPVEVLNVLGAGDAFAAGILYSFHEDWLLAEIINLGH